MYCYVLLTIQTIIHLVLSSDQGPALTNNTSNNVNEPATNSTNPTKPYLTNLKKHEKALSLCQ